VKLPTRIRTFNKRKITLIFVKLVEIFQITTDKLKIRKSKFIYLKTNSTKREKKDSSITLICELGFLER
jgi:hypothetical protein